MTGALVPVIAGELLAPFELRATTCPVEAYLGTLAEASKVTMRSSLTTIAKLVCAESPEAIPWAAWRYEHTAHVRGQLEGQDSPSTANRHLAALRGVLKAAKRLRIISAEAYYEAIDIERVRGSRLPAGRALSHGELRQLFAACQLTTPRGLQQALVVALLFGGGLRLSEPTHLQLADYDPTDGALKVRGKGDKQRRVPLPEGARRAVVAWCTVRGDWPGPLLAPVQKGGLVLQRGLTPRAVAKSIAELADRAGVRELKSHDFRRSYATELLESGADALLVAGLMGHASVETTKRYDRRPEQARAQAAHRLHVPYPEAK